MTTTIRRGANFCQQTEVCWARTSVIIPFCTFIWIMLKKSFCRCLTCPIHNSCTRTMWCLAPISDWRLTPIDHSNFINLDFMKDLNTVQHGRLFGVLEKYWLKGKTMSCKKIFSQNGNKVSYTNCQLVPSGISQGLVLGAIISIMYLNSMPECTKSPI